MDRRLAIKGHPTRGNEVIEILEMLGGANHILEGKDTYCFYYIQTDNNMIRLGHENYCNINDFIIFTLEEFLEKYPYKVGNMVQHKESKSCRSIYKIKKLIWKDNQIHYLVYNPWQEYDKCTITAEYLQPYKEEIYTDNPSDEDAKTDITIDGEKLVPPKGYIIKTATMDGDNLIVEYVKKKPQYPKTYEECCKVLGYDTNKIMVLSNRKDITHEENEHYHEMYNLYQLLICRDAYWKIAGEEMSLGKSWKPVWGRNQPNNYVLHKVSNTILRATDCVESEILAFPTKEMRDAFFENFKDLVEKCKEFL